MSGPGFAPIETERLRLREFALDDAPFVFELLNEPGWKRFIGDRGVDSLATARDYLERVPLAGYRRWGFGLLAIERRDDGEPIGMCGLLRRDWLEDVDIGFALLGRYEGRGFAFEAARATLERAREALGMRRVVAITTLDNERSARLLERLGMRFERTVRPPEGEETLRLFAIDG